MLIEWGDSRLVIAGKPMPGLIQDTSVNAQVRTKDMSVDGGSGSAKMPQGFEDCACAVTILLIPTETESTEVQCAQWQAVYQDTDDTTRPFIYDIAHGHLAARGVRQVFISRLDSAQDEHSGHITVTLGLAQHRPAVVMKEKQRRAKAARAAKKKKDAIATTQAMLKDMFAPEGRAALRALTTVGEAFEKPKGLGEKKAPGAKAASKNLQDLKKNPAPPIQMVPPTAQDPAALEPFAYAGSGKWLGDMNGALSQFNTQMGY